jgi:putative aldouronate transport system substrate-binding protein
MKMRKLTKVMALLIALFMIVISVAACGKNSLDTSSGTQVSGVPTANAFDPMAKYDTPITITTVKRTVQGAKFLNGQSIEGTNAWNDLYKTYGINIQYLWTADASQYDQKLNISITSGDIPDIIPNVSDAQLNILKKADLTMDMKLFLDKYSTDLTKDFNNRDGGAGLKAATFDGKLLFLPGSNMGSWAQADMLWIRQDWLKNVGMSAPKTIDEMEKVMDAFVNKDPNKDGKGGAYALGIGGKDNLIKDWTSIRGVFEGFHCMPALYNNGALFFEKDSSGNVMWSGSKDGVKPALTKMQEWYNKGYLSKDLATTDAGGKFIQDLTASKFGMFYGESWLPNWPLPDLKLKVPTADWIAVPCPTIDGQPPVEYGYCPVQNWYAVSNKCKNPEAVIKMLNLATETKEGKLVDFEKYSADTAATDAGRGWYCSVINLGDPQQDLKDYKAIKGAFAKKDGSALTINQKANYDLLDKYMADLKLTDPKNVAGWSQYWVNSGEEYTSGKLIYEDVTMLMNEYLSPLSDNMSAKIPTYKKIAEEAITKIIYGKSTVDEWDKMINEWNNLGGNEILKEVSASAK